MMQLELVNVLENSYFQIKENVKSLVVPLMTTMIIVLHAMLLFHSVQVFVISTIVRIILGAAVKLVKMDIF